MKFKFIEDDNNQEIIAVGKKNNLIDQIENLCIQDEYNLIGYQNDIFKELNPIEIEYFCSYGDKVYAYINNEEFLVKKRLYELKDLLKDNFIYINQSCLANINQINYFKASFDGSLIVFFKSGNKDYVSRRQIKNVKERILRK